MEPVSGGRRNSSGTGRASVSSEIAVRLGTFRAPEEFPEVSSYILRGAIEGRFPMKALQVHRVAAVERRHGRPCDHGQVHAICTFLAQLAGIQCQIEAVVADRVIPSEYSADARSERLNVGG